MTGYGLAVKFRLKAGAAAAFDALVTETMEGIRALEPGTLVYAVHTVPADPLLRVFYELYADETAFTAHEEQPHVRKFLEARESLLDGVEVDFLSLGLSKPTLVDGDDRS